MSVVRYLTHPQVQIDPTVPVPLWELSAEGLARVEALARTGWLAGTAQVISSGEAKALQTATVLGAALGVAVEVRAAMHENDRSATGFLPPPEFEAMADRFFAEPLASVSGWERAADAQARVVAEVEAVLAREAAGDLLFVGHGAVGTLLYCHYTGLAVDRAHDQPAGGGHYFSFRSEGRRILHPWRPMEQAPPG